MQLWSLQDAVLLDTKTCQSRVLTAVWIPDTPYICLGCEDGKLISLQMLISGGKPAEGICQASELEILVYECKS